MTRVVFIKTKIHFCNVPQINFKLKSKFFRNNRVSDEFLLEMDLEEDVVHTPS